MTEINISARIPTSLERELEKYMKIEHLEKSSAVRRLLFKAIKEWRIEYALKLLADGKVSLLKAAEIADLNIWDFVGKVKESRIQWVSDDIIDRDLSRIL